MAKLVRVLLVEDNDNDAFLIQRELLKNKEFDIFTSRVSTIKEVVHSLTHEQWDIMLVDFKLAGFDAYQVLHILEELRLSTPIVLISGFVDTEVADKFIRAGGHDYISKDSLARIHPVLKQALMLTDGIEATLRAWISAIDLRDSETKGHSERVVSLTDRIGKAMGINESQLVHMRRGALLHDVGKMQIPDAILLKPGKLDEAEMQTMRMHPEIGYSLLKPIKFLEHSLDIPHYHHERWDGSGYPFGLEGISIPLGARIFAVADVFDAMTSDRPYRNGLTKEFVVESIKGQSGILFDPNVVTAFLSVIEKEI